MAIAKQAFYEGAALYQLICATTHANIIYEMPFFRVNRRRTLYLKFTTKGRSPWGFSVSAEEQALLFEESTKTSLYLGLVCGADGVAALAYESFAEVASLRNASVHIACYRRHGEHYEINGPDGTLSRKVPPSSWQHILNNGSK